MSEPLLKVSDLSVHVPSAVLLDKISFQVSAGETLGVLGESGAGKTTLARSVMQLLPTDAWGVTGSIFFEGYELSSANDRQLQRVRGARMSLILQEPELALNPVLTVGRQIDEVLRAHSKHSGRERRERVLAMMAATGLPDAVYSAYPHELSGGQRQRIVISQALIAQPSLLIADEPTSALDTTTQASILRLLKNLQERLHLTLIFITHNPALLSRLANRVLVLRAGRVVETGSFEQVYWSARDAYTKRLTTQTW